MKNNLNYYFSLFLSWGVWIATILNALLLTAGVVGMLAPNSSFSQGEFVKNPILYLMILSVNILFLICMIKNLNYHVNNIFLIMILGVISNIGSIPFLIEERTVVNLDKEFSLILLGLINIYICLATLYICVDYLLTKKFNSSKFLKRN